MYKKLIGILIIGLLITTILPIGTPNINIDEVETDSVQIFLENKLIGIGSISIDISNKITGFVFVGINNGQIIITENIEIQSLSQPNNVFNGIPFAFFITYEPATDADGDGYYAESDDCDDTNPDVHPGATEICNGIDDDCNYYVDDNPVDGEIYYLDEDSDGYGVDGDYRNLCDMNPPYTAVVAGDCDDGDHKINPGATEICNGIDDDCDSEIDEGC